MYSAVVEITHLRKWSNTMQIMDIPFTMSIYLVRSLIFFLISALLL